MYKIRKIRLKTTIFQKKAKKCFRKQSKNDSNAQPKVRKKDLCPKVIQTTTQHFSLLENPSASAKNPLKIFSGIFENKQEILSVKIQENDVVYPFPIFNQKRC